VAEDRMAEFLALSNKVSDKTASDEERTRWRELRAELAAQKPTPPLPPGSTPRAHDRATRKLKLHYAPLNEMTISFTDEVGGGGLRLRAQKHLEVGTLLVLKIDATPPLTLEARVVWCKREGGHFAVGVEFVDVPAAEAERLEALTHQKP
jgi:hypothetical protein